MSYHGTATQTMIYFFYSSILIPKCQNIIFINAHIAFLFLSLSTFFIHHFYPYKKILVLIPLIPTPNFMHSHHDSSYSKPSFLCSQPDSLYSQHYSLHSHPDNLHSYYSYPQSFTRYLRLSLVFMSNSALQEKFNFCFFKSFLLVLNKFLFWQEDWAPGYHSMTFRHLPDIPNFLRS